MLVKLRYDWPTILILGAPLALTAGAILVLFSAM
jgi:hypothetical protein